ncbi:MAG: DNA polymerase, partial [Candidatus Micrarchaeia archaeon]
LNINKFYSIGYLAYEYLKMKKIKIENLNYEVEKYLNNFVRGGWVEVIQRGFFEKVYYYDVNSFYPFQISKLKDLSGAIFNFSKKIDDKSDYCYIECILSLKDDIDYSFLGFKDKDGVMKYGILKNVKYYLTKKEYETLKKYRMIEKIKILKVLNVYLREKKYLFREIINELYKNRRKNDEFLSYISKIIMNSVYGKFLESKKEFINFSFIDYLNNIDEDFKVNCYKHKFFRKDCVECRELNKIKNEIEKKEKINRIYFTSDRELMKSIDIAYGRLRNILYGIEVLANSRIYLFEILKNNFKNSDIIAVFTDGFFVKKRIRNKKLIGEKMGQLKEKKYKKLLMIGCGVYQADNNLKIRGYNIKIDLFKEFKKNKNKKIIKLKSKELISLGRSIFTSKYNEDDINKIKNILKEFDINFDKKRKFSEWTCRDFLVRNEKGKILTFGLDKKFKKTV